MKKRLLLSLIFVLSLTKLFSAEKTRDYKETTAFLKTLNSNFIVKEIDTVKYNNVSYPIYKITYNQLKDKKGKKYLILSGVHGNEPAPVFAVRDFIISLNKQEVSRKDLQIDFVLIVNPYGFEYNQRYNGANLDINRDMTKCETQEAKILTKNFNPKDYDKFFDFHEANAKGFFLYCYGMKNKSLAKKIHEELKKINVVFENEYKDNILKVKDGYLDVPFYASMYMKSKKTVTTAIYFKSCSNSFTFETSKNADLNQRKKIIITILNYIIKNV